MDKTKLIQKLENAGIPVKNGKIVRADLDKARQVLAEAPKIKNGDMIQYAKDLGEFLMSTKLGIISAAERRDMDEIKTLCEDLNHVEQELKNWDAE